MITQENREKIKKFLEKYDKIDSLALAIGSAVSGSENAYSDVARVAQKIGVNPSELIEYGSEPGEHNLVDKFRLGNWCSGSIWQS